MQRLANVEELLDGTLDDRRALQGNLRDLRRINRLLGGVRLSERALAALLEHADPAEWNAGGLNADGSNAGGATADGPTADGSTAGGSTASVLDVGCGAADIPLALADRARRAGSQLRFVAVDARPEVLEAAIALEPRLAGGDVELHVADGRRLPYPDRSFDVAHASMVLHHLEPHDAIGLLGELKRVARRGVVVNDLARSRAAVVGAWLMGHLLTSNRYTRNDAPLSVRRAYRPTEMRSLLAAAGLRPVFEASALLAHRYAFAAVPDPPTATHVDPYDPWAASDRHAGSAR